MGMLYVGCVATFAVSGTVIGTSDGNRACSSLIFFLTILAALRDAAHLYRAAESERHNVSWRVGTFGRAALSNSVRRLITSG